MKRNEKIDMTVCEMSSNCESVKIVKDEKRKKDSKKQKIFATIFASSVSVLAVFLILFFAIIPAIMLEVGLTRSGFEWFKQGIGKPLFTLDHYSPSDDQEYLDWIDSVSTSSYIKSFDGLNLHALNVKTKNPTNKYAIICHGYGRNAKSMAYHGKQFLQNGYNILLPDARAHGESEGEIITLGWTERKDILLWIEKIIQNDENAQIVLYGVSMGGATIMSTVGENLPKNVKVAVEDCGYTNAYEELNHCFFRYGKLKDSPIVDVCRAMMIDNIGFDFVEASAKSQVAKCKTPIMFVHGDKDEFVPTKMVYELFESAKCEKKLYVQQGAVHANSCTFPNYWQNVFEFVEKFM